LAITSSLVSVAPGFSATTIRAGRVGFLTLRVHAPCAEIRNASATVRFLGDKESNDRQSWPAVLPGKPKVFI
jgi:hypothetical protein